MGCCGERMDGFSFYKQSDVMSSPPWPLGLVSEAGQIEGNA